MILLAYYVTDDGCTVASRSYFYQCQMEKTGIIIKEDTWEESNRKAADPAMGDSGEFLPVNPTYLP